MVKVRYGNQKPRIDIFENGDIWLADKTIELVSYYGVDLKPWQKSILYRWMALDDDGKWANPDCGLLVSRQNGKSELLIARIIGGMVFLGEALIYTAQSDKTVQEIRRRVQRFFYDAEEEIRDMLTEEFDQEPKSLDYLELRNRGRCVFRTRTRTSGLGSSNDVLLLDECLPADTVVDGKPIQQYKIGDCVLSYNATKKLVEYKKVTRVIKKPTPQEMYCISGNGGIIISTGNHKHLTQRGWVKAENFKKGDVLYYDKSRKGSKEMARISTTMQDLRRSHRLPNSSSKSMLLKAWLCILHKPRLLQQRAIYWHESRTNKKQPYVERSKPTKMLKNIKENGVEAKDTWRQRSRTYKTATDITRAAWRWLESRICGAYCTGKAIRHPSSLQNRFSQSVITFSSRVRWSKPFSNQNKASRQKKRHHFRTIRVESVTILKQKDYKKLGFSDGGNYVYCIDVENNHNFFANGVLTHNCQEETDGQQEALLPTVSAGKSQNYQTIRAGTPPTAGSSGTVFVRMRNNVLDGKATDVCWQEWSVEAITDPLDEEAWYNTNPSLGYFLMKSAIKKEAGQMALDSFNKMRLGWVAGVESQRAITDEQWQPLAIEKVTLPENPNLVYSVKFAPDRSAVSLSVGVLMPDGKVHVEVVERRQMNAGTGWLAAWLLERRRKCNKIIIDGAAGTQLLVEELVRSEKKISKRILTPNVREAGAAYAAFYNAIENQNLTHFDQPALNISVKTVKKRDIGRDGMFGYASMNSDIQSDPVESVAFAYYGAIRFKKDKNYNGSTQRVMV